MSFEGVYSNYIPLDLSLNSSNISRSAYSYIAMNSKANNLKYWTEPTTNSKRINEVFGGYLPQLKNAKILDVGSSRGETTNELADIYQDSNVVGIDIFINRLKHASKKSEEDPSRSNQNYVLADAYFAPFKDESFDAIFAMNSIYYSFDNTEGNQKKAFDSIANMLKEGGYLFISGRRKGMDNAAIFTKNKGELKLMDSYKNMPSSLDKGELENIVTFAQNWKAN